MRRWRQQHPGSRPLPEVQDLTFSGVGTGRSWFALQLGSTGTHHGRHPLRPHQCVHTFATAALIVRLWATAPVAYTNPPKLRRDLCVPGDLRRGQRRHPRAAISIFARPSAPTAHPATPFPGMMIPTEIRQGRRPRGPPKFPFAVANLWLCGHVPIQRLDRHDLVRQFREVWNEDALTNTGNYSNTNLYFRTFQESTDTAGPQVANWSAPSTAERPSTKTSRSSPRPG